MTARVPVGSVRLLTAAASVVSLVNLAVASAAGVESCVSVVALPPIDVRSRRVEQAGHGLGQGRALRERSAVLVTIHAGAPTTCDGRVGLGQARVLPEQQLAGPAVGDAAGERAESWSAHTE